jgi:hypothetical protein
MFVNFLIIGHSSSPNNVTILRSLPYVLLPLGPQGAEILAPKILWKFVHVWPPVRPL